MGQPGEKMTWPEQDWPSPQQWLEWFESLTPERKLEVAELVCQNNEFAAMCFEQDHVGQITRLMDRLRGIGGGQGGGGGGSLIVTGVGIASPGGRGGGVGSAEASPMRDHAGEQRPASQSAPQALPTIDSVAPDEREGE